MTYYRATASEADKIARKFTERALSLETAGFTDVRDFCDTYTGSDMTCYQLGRLAEMVLRRLPSNVEG